MKKIAFLLISFVCFSCFAETDPANNEETDEIVNIGHHMVINTQAYFEKSPTSKMNIQVSYPRIVGESLSKNALQFNRLVKNMINEKIDSFKKGISEEASQMKSLPASVQNNRLDIDFDLSVMHPHNNKTLISVRMKFEEMKTGRAHPYHTYQVLNYDLDKGKTLSLADVFKPSAPYLKLIANLSNSKLHQALNDQWLIDQGTKIDPKNFATWNLQDDSLLITFHEYQVAPYAQGPQEIEIPYSDLKKVLAPSLGVY